MHVPSLKRIYMRILAVPVLLAIGSVFFDWFFARQAETFAQSVYLRGLAQSAADMGYYGSGALLLAAAVLTVAASARLWLWENGHTECCDHCGGPMGFDDRCLSCRRKKRYW